MNHRMVEEIKQTEGRGENLDKKIKIMNLMFLHICLFHDCCGGRCSANFLATSLIASGVLKGSFSLLGRSFGIEKQEKINKKLKNQKKIKKQQQRKIEEKIPLA